MKDRTQKDSTKQGDKEYSSKTFHHLFIHLLILMSNEHPYVLGNHLSYLVWNTPS